MGSSGSGFISAGVVHRHLDVASPGFGAETLAQVLLFHVRHTPTAKAPLYSLRTSRDPSRVPDCVNTRKSPSTQLRTNVLS